MWPAMARSRSSGEHDALQGIERLIVVARQLAHAIRDPGLRQIRKSHSLIRHSGHREAARQVASDVRVHDGASD
jgi:hypothetical protein